MVFGQLYGQMAHGQKFDDKMIFCKKTRTKKDSGSFCRKKLTEFFLTEYLLTEKSADERKLVDHHFTQKPFLRNVIFPNN
jgi:hypothetical protein